MKCHFDSAKITSVFESLEKAKVPPATGGIDMKMKPLRRYNPRIGKVIFVCPRCGMRVKMFTDNCQRCTQTLNWDMNVT